MSMVILAPISSRRIPVLPKRGQQSELIQYRWAQIVHEPADVGRRLTHELVQALELCHEPN